MAGTLNKVQLIGRLGQDPRTAYTNSGNPVVNFNLATDESYKNQAGEKIEKTEWHRLVIFGKPAEFCSNYLSKGSLVYIEGKNQTRKWQDKEGNDRYTTEVLGKVVQSLESKGQKVQDDDSQAAGGSEDDDGGFGDDAPF